MKTLPRSVFLSYTSNDAPFAAQLRKALRDRGLVAVEIAKDAAVGPSIEDELRETLGRADWVVGVIGPTSKQSSLVNFEIGYALSQGIPAMLVTREARSLEQMPLHIRRLVTVVNEKSPREIALRIARILQLLPPRARTADFGSYLRQLMATRGMSEATLAAAAGVSQSTVSRILSNDEAPSAALFSSLVLGFDNLKAKLSEDELRAWMTLATQTFGPTEGIQRGRREAIERRIRKSQVRKGRKSSN